jgi:hypothetical protein
MEMATNMSNKRSVIFRSPDDSFDSLTPPCNACGEENVGVGVPVVMSIPGMMFINQQYDAPIFIPDTDAQLRIEQLPNGMIGFVTDEKITKYEHKQCYDQLIDEVAYGVGMESDGEEDDEEDDEEGEDDVENEHYQEGEQ